MSTKPEQPAGGVQSQGKSVPPSLLNSPQVINIRLASFAEELTKQGTPVVHVDWSPPAHGDVELANLLAKLSD